LTKDIATRSRRNAEGLEAEDSLTQGDKGTKPEQAFGA
jgi:hypothetical protein